MITYPNDIWLSVFGHHKDGFSNSQVQSFTITTQIVYFMPAGLEAFFTNLEVLVIENCGLKALRREDLKNFGDLKVINFDSNDLEELESDLFAFNVKLEAISLEDNLILKIDAQIFDNLNSLRFLRLKMNKCVDESVENDRGGVRELIEEVKNQCEAPEI